MDNKLEAHMRIFILKHMARIKSILMDKTGSIPQKTSENKDQYCDCTEFTVVFS